MDIQKVTNVLKQLQQGSTCSDSLSSCSFRISTVPSRESQGVAVVLIPPAAAVFLTKDQHREQEYDPIVDSYTPSSATVKKIRNGVNPELRAASESAAATSG